MSDLTAPRAATFGPLTLNVTSPVTIDDADRFGPLVRKLRVSWTLTIAGADVAGGPYFYGSADHDALEPPRPGDVLQSVLQDLAMIEPHQLDDELESWASWADEMGVFVDGNAASVRDSISDYRTISGWRAAIVDALDPADAKALEGRSSDGGPILAELLDVADMLEREEVTLDGVELEDAGTVNDPDDAYRGQRYADDRGNVYSASELLAATLELAGLEVIA